MLAVIPARAGSKGIPDKNISSFGGHPLIAWTIQTAKDSKLFERIVVSTDGATIAEIAQAYGAQTHQRPDRLATDTASPKDVVIHLYGSLAAEGYLPSHIVLLQPTSPLRTVEDLRATVDLVLEGSFDSAATYSPAIPHPERAFFIDDKAGARPVFDVDSVWRPRQVRVPQFHLNGAVYAVETQMFLDQPGPQFLIGRIGAHVMPPERSIDIDTYTDLKIAEFLMEPRAAPLKTPSRND